jgi:hypothetical protein
MFSMSTSRPVEVCLKFSSSFLLWRLRDEHKTPSTENFFEDKRLSGIIICSDSSLLPWNIFTSMLMASAFCSVWIYNCISRYKVRTSFDVPHPPISKGGALNKYKQISMGTTGVCRLLRITNDVDSSVFSVPVLGTLASVTWHGRTLVWCPNLVMDF